MSLPDNRVRFPPVTINFPAQVGVTGQDHDSYPGPDDQARFDWMRMFLIGLLANQSSNVEPTQFRDGSLWFDLTSLTLRIRRAGAWDFLASAIGISKDANGHTITLADLYTTIKAIATSKPTAIFSGLSENNGIRDIPIPIDLRQAAGAGSQPLIHINGIMADPRHCAYVGASVVRLSGGLALARGDRFTVIMQGIFSELNYPQDVIV